MSFFFRVKWPGIGLWIACVAAMVHSQETLSSVQRELDRVERETDREKDLHKEERARAAEFDKRKTEKLQALRDQTRLVDVASDSLKRQMEVEQRRKAAQKNQAAMYQAKQKEFRSALAKEIESMISWEEKDFPYQSEKRLSDWRDLAKANKEGSLPVEETMTRLFSLVQASLDFSQDTEAYPGTYTATDGGQWEGTYVRLGAVSFNFASNDGKEFAYLSKRDSGYVWRDKNLSPGARSGIQTAVQVAQGKAPPQLVPLPMDAPKARVVSQ